MAVRGCVLGLDYGSRRIGLAISDLEGLFAFPAGALERTRLEQDLQALGRLIAERGVTRVVVGLPLHMSGRSGQEAEAARAFARALGEATKLPVEMLDERWTSREAERALRDAPGRRKRSRGSVDSVAATLLLRTYLERERGAAGGDLRNEARGAAALGRRAGAARRRRRGDGRALGAVAPHAGRC